MLVKANISERTKANYLIRYKRFIKPAFGSMFLSDIRNLDCQMLMNTLQGYSGDYIRQVYDDLNQVFETAILI